MSNYNVVWPGISSSTQVSVERGGLVPGRRSPPTASSHWRQPVKEKKEVINLSRRSSGGGWRRDGLGQNFWDGSFQGGKDCFHLETSRFIACCAQCGIHFGLVAEWKQSFCLLGKRKFYQLIVMIFLLFVFIIVSAWYGLEPKVLANKCQNFYLASDCSKRPVGFIQRIPKMW